MAVRLNKNYLCIGRRGTGKTTIAKAIAAATGRKICVIDTDFHPSYAKDFTLYKIADLPKWKSGNIRLITSNPEHAMKELNTHCTNAFIICEDAAKYVNANVQKPVKAFIIDHRKRDFDILLMFHFLADVPPYVAKQYDSMIIFKTGDNLETKQPKFANWHKILKVAKEVNAHKEFNFCIKIAIDE